MAKVRRRAISWAGDIAEPGSVRWRWAGVKGGGGRGFFNHAWTRMASLPLRLGIYQAGIGRTWEVVRSSEMGR